MSDVRAQVRQILLNDWDPHDAGRNAEAHGTYDVYIDPIVHILQTSPDEEALVSFLHEKESESMCFPSLGTRRLRSVARKLLQIQSSSR